MGMRMIKQDNGKFGLFSTFDDRIKAFDLSEEEMIEIWKERAAIRAEEEMKDWLAEAKGERPRHSTPMTTKQALEKHRFIENRDNPENADDIEWDDKIKEELKQ